jgi:hypothetical protein
MKIKLLFLLAFAIITPCFAIKPPIGNSNQLPNAGQFSVGGRNTFGIFNSHGSASYGMGGQFRLRLSERVNTEWYADYITSHLDHKVGRTDYHIGWSVFYYYLPQEAIHKAKILPFIEAGHCFDYTALTIVGAIGNGSTKQRWSSAVQMGTGAHINLTNRFDVTLKVQYMLHLGGDIHAHEHHPGHYVLEEHTGVEREGHVLSTISVNYKIGNLWTGK